MNQIEHWFASRGWSPFEFQRAAWVAYRAGRDGLVHAPTGMGKSYAAFGGPVLEWIDGQGEAELWKQRSCEPLRVLWVTPLRPWRTDTTHTLTAMAAGLGLPWSVELRTGDTAASVKKRQRTRLPTVLVTTPESLTVLLSYPDARERFGTLRCIVVDEWHELMGTKRGVQTELALARLRGWSPDVRTWGMSATMGNLEEAMEVLVGANPLPLGRGWRVTDLICQWMKRAG